MSTQIVATSKRLVMLPEGFSPSSSRLERFGDPMMLKLISIVPFEPSFEILLVTTKLVADEFARVDPVVECLGGAWLAMGQCK
ncbi:hypothetical protein K7X08_025703 [Anisodus acutangulus]|uniref:Uncharacterized protein n=1 Tax=Anisodus acutangulus TaxID=402998 RepID=A0A9Q1L7Z3_9SOLA|nr:hypothetical protein K7X08_025703 [Anisodus acutangulus]